MQNDSMEKMERDLWWHCDFCGDHGPAEDPYVNGDTEPCVTCGEGVSRVMTLKDAARLESAIAQGLVQPRRAYSCKPPKPLNT